MKKLFDTPEDVEREIERLQNSPFVRLARKKKQVDEARRQYMYTLRMFEKKGLSLAAEGWTMDKLSMMEVEE